MAKTLHGLIRLHSWQVDEERRKLAELLRLLDEFEAQARNLEVELHDEQQVAGASPEVAGFLYGGYAQAVIERRHRIAESVAGAEDAIAAARESLWEAFRELKKFQITQANRDRREAEETKRLEQEFVDEVGLQGFRRRNG